MAGTSFRHRGYPRLVLNTVLQGNSGISKIIVVPSGTLSETPNLADFSAYLPRSSTVARAVNLNSVYTIQPVVQPDVQYERSCTTDLTTGWMFVYTIQNVVQPLVKPFDNRFDNRLYRVNGVLVRPTTVPCSSD